VPGGTGGILDGGVLPDTGDLGGGLLDNPLLGADLSGPVDGTAVVGGDISEVDDALITADVDAPPIDAIGTDLLGGTDIGDAIGGDLLDSPLLGADLSGTVNGTAVVGGDISEVDDALITADVDGPPIDAIGADLLDDAVIGDTLNDLVGGVDTGPIDGIDLGNPLLGANLDDTTLVIPGEESDFDDALITVDADTPAETNLLDDTVIGDTLNDLGGVDTGPLGGTDLGNPLIGANLDDTSVVLPGDDSDFANALITVDADTPLGDMGGTDLGNLPGRCRRARRCARQCGPKRRLVIF
jgi:hypothetical protein